MTGPAIISDRSALAADLVFRIGRLPPDIQAAIRRMIDRMTDGMDADLAERLFEKETGRKLKR